MPSTRGYIFSISVAALIFALVLAFVPQVQQPLEEKTYCYKTVTTLSADKSSANCFTVSSTGTFSRVFSDELSTRSTERHRHVIPGLWDGHGHLLQYGEFLQSVDLFGSQSLDGALERVRNYAREHPSAGLASEWVRGAGWDQAAFGRMPTATDLEAEPTLKGKYIMLDRVDVHCIWVSEAVMSLLPSPFPDIPGGEIVTDPGPGVFCDNAMDLVMQYWPKPSRDKKVEFINTAMAELNKLGLVGMHDAGVTPENLRLYDDLANDDKFTLRVYAMLECEKRNTFCLEDASMIARRDGLLTMRSVKLFADGALGSWGSAMLEPYSDRPSMSGSLLVNSSTLTSLTRDWSNAGYQVNIHAIGDLANRLAVDAMEDAYQNLCPDDSAYACQSRMRFRIEHAQIIHPADQKRMFEMGIIPSIQPTHATSDMYYAEDRLGKKRTKDEAYRMRSLLPINPILGSDFPVEPPNPFEGIFAAVTRRSPRTGLGKNGEKTGWYEVEALSLEDALRGFTIGPAHGAFLEGKAGVIQEGAFADWVVVDEPIDGIDIDRLRTISVRETWVNGRCVYRRDDEARQKYELK